MKRNVYEKPKMVAVIIQQTLLLLSSDKNNKGKLPSYMEAENFGDEE